MQLISDYHEYDQRRYKLLGSTRTEVHSVNMDGTKTLKLKTLIKRYTGGAPHRCWNQCNLMYTNWQVQLCTQHTSGPHTGWTISRTTNIIKLPVGI